MLQLDLVPRVQRSYTLGQYTKYCTTLQVLYMPKADMHFFYSSTACKHLSNPDHIRFQAAPEVGGSTGGYEACRQVWLYRWLYRLRSCFQTYYLSTVDAAGSQLPVWVTVITVIIDQTVSHTTYHLLCPIRVSSPATSLLKMTSLPVRYMKHSHLICEERSMLNVSQTPQELVKQYGKCCVCMCQSLCQTENLNDCIALSFTTHYPSSFSISIHFSHSLSRCYVVPLCLAKRGPASAGCNHSSWKKSIRELLLI